MTDPECELPECEEVTIPWLDPRFCGRAHRAIARRRADEELAVEQNAAASWLTAAATAQAPALRAEFAFTVAEAAGQPPAPRPAATKRAGWRRLLALLAGSA